MGAENITNISDLRLGLSDILPLELLGELDKLIFISKIAAYIFIGYIVFLIIRQIYGWRRNRRISAMFYQIKDIDKKLDLLLDLEKVKLKKERVNKEKKLKEVKKEEKKIKKGKKGFFDIFKFKKKKSKEK